MGDGLIVVGTLLQLVGIGFTGLTLAETRERFAPGRPGIVGTLGRWWGRFLRWGERHLRRLFRQPRNVTVHDVGVALAGAAAFDASIRLGFGPLPEGLTDQERIALLDERIRKVQTEVHALEDKVTADQEATKASQQAARAEASQAVVDLREDMTTGFAGSLRRESAGLLIAAVGIVIALVGSLL